MNLGVGHVGPKGIQTEVVPSADGCGEKLVVCLVMFGDPAADLKELESGWLDHGHFFLWVFLFVQSRAFLRYPFSWWFVLVAWGFEPLGLGEST